MTSLIDNLIARAWNHFARPTQQHTNGLVAGYAIVDEQTTTRLVTWPTVMRSQHAAITGRTGTGKTMLILSWAQADFEAGNGLVVLDVHGQLSDLLLKTAAAWEGRTGQDASERLLIIRPGDPEFSVGLNPLEFSAETSLFSLVSEFAAILRQRWNLDSLGARTEELLRNVLYAVAECRLTLLEVPAFLTSPSFRALCLKKTGNPEIREYFESRFNAASEAMQNSMSGPVLNKLTAFTSDPRFRHILGQQQSTVSVADMLNKNLAVVLDLSKGTLGEESLTLGSLFLTKLKNGVFARRSRKLFTIYADEVQNFVATGASLETLYSECRKFGISVVTGQQHLAQLPAAIRAAQMAIGTHICFQLSSDDAQHMAVAFGGGKPLAEQLRNLPHRHFVIKSGSAPWRQAVTPLLTIPKTAPADLYRRCVARWARPRAEVEAEIGHRKPTVKRSAREVMDAWE
jgi:hypothetical protein